MSLTNYHIPDPLGMGWSNTSRVQFARTTDEKIFNGQYLKIIECTEWLICIWCVHNKLLRQFAHFVVHRILYTRFYLFVQHCCHTCKCFFFYSSSPKFVCKVSWYMFCEYPVAFQPLPLHSTPRYEQNTLCDLITLNLHTYILTIHTVQMYMSM